MKVVTLSLKRVDVTAHDYRRPQFGRSAVPLRTFQLPYSPCSGDKYALAPLQGLFPLGIRRLQGVEETPLDGVDNAAKRATVAAAARRRRRHGHALLVLISPPF